MRLLFLFDTVMPDELTPLGGLKSDSRSVRLFKYLTGVVKKANPDAVTTMLVASPTAGKAKAKELKEHAKLVQESIAQFDPTLIAVMGKTALYAVLPYLPSDFPKTLSYKRLWGKHFTHNSASGSVGKERAACVFSPSPSMVWAGKQQEGGYLYLRTIQENIMGAVLQFTDRIGTVSHLVSDAAHLHALVGEWTHTSGNLTRIITEPTIGFDTETTGLNIVSDKVRTVQFSVKDGEAYVVPFDILPADDWTKLLHRLKEAGYKLVLQNGKYDAKILHHNGVDLGRYSELSIAHVLVDERADSHNLDAIGQQILGAGKASITTDKLVNGPIDQTFIDYAGRDTDITRRAFNIILPSVKDKPAYRILTDSAYHLSRGEAFGIRLDRERLYDLRDQTARTIAAYEGEFKEIGLNPMSPKQVAELLQTSKADKKALEGHDSEWADKIIDYRGLLKVQNTYLRRLIASYEVDGRFHPDIRLAGPVTGRTSSGTDKDVGEDELWLPINSQNIPRPNMGQETKYLSERLRADLRSCFIADEGRQMVAFDLAAAEMRMAANACLDPVMIDDLNRKVDTHSLLTIMALKLDIEIDLDNPDEWVKHIKKNYESQRQSTKNATFAVLYGGGISAIAAQAKCDTTTAALLRRTIYERYRGLETWIDRIHSQVKEKGYIETRYGRKRIFPYSTGVFDNQMLQSMLREAQNYVIQSEASDYCLMGINKFMDNIPSSFAPVYFQNFVHDAGYFSVAEDDADDAKKLMVEMVQSADKLPAVLYADAKYAKNWGDL